MSLDFNKGGSRYGRTTKRKKTNMILNILIGVVFIFIVVLASSLFFGKNDPATDGENQLATEEQELSETEENEAEQESEEAAPTDEEETESEEAEESAEKDAEKEKEKDKDKDKEQEKEEEANEADDSETEVSENSNDPNVIKTMTNPGWGPVGTSQSEPHTSVYDEGHVDWNEKLKAVEAATRLSSGEYTLYFLGNGGSEHLSVASIKDKSTGENFKVYLEWVTNKGWKPTKVEQVKSL